MKESMEFYRNDYWLAYPLPVSGGLGALGIAVFSGFAANGLVMAAGLIAVTAGLHVWSRNRYRILLQTIEQVLLDSSECKNELKVKASQGERNKNVLLDFTKEVEAERQRIETLLTDLALRFDALSSRIGGQDQDSTAQDETMQHSVEAQIADLARRFDGLLNRIDQPAVSEKPGQGIDGLDSLCQK
ncbi:MAG: hypothetical protein WAW41_06355, partial [Methylobacter sp.]